jgi:glycosyltransferase involved in cell wall biosynthesis
MTPAVSIVLPTFERLELLRATIESVFRQTLQDWELIVADDGSGSDVQAYLDELARDPRVRVLRLEHSGNAARVRNRALQLVRSEYVAFLDSDDLWEPAKLERQLALMRGSPGCEWGYPAYTMIDGSGAPLPSERDRQWTPYGGRIFREVVRTVASIPIAGVIASAGLIRDVGGFDEAIDCSEDYDLWMRLALRSPACVIDEPLVRVRRHAANTARRAGAAHVARDYSLRKLATQADAAQRALLAEERSRNALARARAIAARGGRWHALGVVAGSLPFGWKYAGWWYGAARVVARACIGPRRDARESP